jgi:hypothetical protein
LFPVDYRYLPYPNAPPTNQFGPYFVLNFPGKGGFSFPTETAPDLNWSSGNFSWHYRNRVSVKRPWKIHGWHFSPYVSAEFWYTSRHSKWITTSIFAGCLFPFGKYVDFNPYYEHQSKSGKSPNQQLNPVGIDAQPLVLGSRSGLALTWKNGSSPSQPGDILTVWGQLPERAGCPAVFLARGWRKKK